MRWLAASCGGRKRGFFAKGRRCCVPKVHRLGPNGAIPELLEAGGCFGPGGRVDGSAGIGAGEEGTEGAEDAGAGAERHGVLVWTGCSCAWWGGGSALETLAGAGGLPMAGFGFVGGCGARAGLGKARATANRTPCPEPSGQ